MSSKAPTWKNAIYPPYSTKNDVLDFLRENEVQVKTVVKGEQTTPPKDVQDKIALLEQDKDALMPEYMDALDRKGELYDQILDRVKEVLRDEPDKYGYTQSQAINDLDYYYLDKIRAIIHDDALVDAYDAAGREINRVYSLKEAIGAEIRAGKTHIGGPQLPIRAQPYRAVRITVKCC